MFQEFYSKLSEQEKKIFSIALLFGVLAFFDMLLLRPFFSKIQSLDGEIVEKKSALRQDLRFLSYKDKIFNEQSVLNVFETDESKSEEEIIAGFLKTVELLASEAKVNLSKITPADVTKKKGIVEYFASLECEGRLEDMMLFIHKIDETKNLLKVVKVDLSGSKTSAEGIKANMKVVKLIIDPKTIGNYQYTEEVSLKDSQAAAATEKSEQKTAKAAAPGSAGTAGSGKDGGEGKSQSAGSGAIPGQEKGAESSGGKGGGTSGSGGKAQVAAGQGGAGGGAGQTGEKSGGSGGGGTADKTGGKSSGGGGGQGEGKAGGQGTGGGSGGQADTSRAALGQGVGGAGNGGAGEAGSSGGNGPGEDGKAGAASGAAIGRGGKEASSGGGGGAGKIGSGGDSEEGGGGGGRPDTGSGGGSGAGGAGAGGESNQALASGGGSGEGSGGGSGSGQVSGRAGGGSGSGEGTSGQATGVGGNGGGGGNDSSVGGEDGGGGDGGGSSSGGGGGGRISGSANAGGKVSKGVGGGREQFEEDLDLSGRVKRKTPASQSKQKPTKEQPVEASAQPQEQSSRSLPPKKLNKLQETYQKSGEGGRVRIDSFETLWASFFGKKIPPADGGASEQ